MQSDIAALKDMLPRRGFVVESFDETPSRNHEKKPAHVPGKASVFLENRVRAPDPTSPEAETQMSLSAHENTDRPNKLEDFIRGIDRAHSVEDLMKRRWGTTQTKPLLSRICRLDRQNAALFLPVLDVIGAQERGRGLPDEETEW